MKIRTGFGYDVHRLEEGREFWLGGVVIPYEKGALGHSDADVLIHAICDALLGAAAMGDIGKHFPDTDADFKNIDSRILLRHVKDLIVEAGHKVANIDATIIAQRPKLLPHIISMRENLSDDLGIEMSQLNIKATTTEKLGFEGREEGIAAMAIVLLE